MSLIERWQITFDPDGVPRAVTLTPDARAERNGWRAAEYVPASQLRGAVEERDALARLVALYREYGSPDLTRLVEAEAKRLADLTQLAGGQS